MQRGIALPTQVLKYLHLSYALGTKNLSLPVSGLLATEINESILSIYLYEETKFCLRHKYP